MPDSGLVIFGPILKDSIGEEDCNSPSLRKTTMDADTIGINLAALLLKRNVRAVEKGSFEATNPVPKAPSKCTSAKRSITAN